MIIRPLLESGDLPLLLAPSTESDATADALQKWLSTHSTKIDKLLQHHGALLFRDFQIASPDTFRSIAQTLTGEIKAYVGGDSPRNRIVDKVYTSTEFPADMEITLHNELTYSGWWPSRIMFWCKQAPASGGQTQIADARKVYQHIDESVRDRFENKGVRYVRSYHNEGGAGKTWQQAFETDNREEVEKFCADTNMDCEWFDWGLRTLTFGPGVYTHPVTGEMAWINQADQFHAEYNTPWANDFSADDFDQSQLPFHAYFGDGSAINVSDLDERRNVQRQFEVLFDWKEGDILLLDNILTMHGRKPYSGAREILVAMG
ncbi:MAG: alpha-ketoglutarate-dependent taurine dioxygenase [Planctomycetota bacterium]|jgi:alpha-ketoglutarate-dependent taurine dioxygenase